MRTSDQLSNYPCKYNWFHGRSLNILSFEFPECLYVVSLRPSSLISFICKIIFPFEKDSHYLTQMNLRLIFLSPIICSAVACSRSTGDDKHLSAKLSPVIAVEDSKTAGSIMVNKQYFGLSLYQRGRQSPPHQWKFNSRSEILMNTQQPRYFDVDFQINKSYPVSSKINTCPW